MSMTHSLKPCLCSDTKHGSQQCTAQPTPLIYHVNFSNSPCSPCWPDNPCRQLQTIHTDRKGNGSWGSAQCVSGYDTPVNQMEIPQYAPAKRNLDVISLSGLQPTSQITDPTSFYFLPDCWMFHYHSLELLFFKQVNYWYYPCTIDTHKSLLPIYEKNNYYYYYFYILCLF